MKKVGIKKDLRKFTRCESNIPPAVRPVGASPVAAGSGRRCGRALSGRLGNHDDCGSGFQHHNRPHTTFNVNIDACDVSAHRTHAKILIKKRHEEF